MRIQLLLLAALGGFAVALHAADAPPQDAPNAKDLEVTLAPDKAALMIGEPVYVTLTVKNKSSHDLDTYFPWSPENYVPDGIAVAVTDAEGKPAKIVEPVLSLGDQRRLYHSNWMGYEKIPAGGSITRRHLLFCQYGHPGAYSINASYAIALTDTDMATRQAPRDHSKPPAPRLQSASSFEVLPADNARMGELITSLLQSDSHGGDLALNEADKKLLMMEDDRTLPFLEEMLLSGHGEWVTLAGAALDRLKEHDATVDCLKDCLALDAQGRAKTPVNSGGSAAGLLLSSTNPRALDFLLTLTHHPDAGVRMRVLEALKTRASAAQAIPLLRGMTGDEDATISASAKRALEILAKNENAAP